MKRRRNRGGGGAAIGGAYHSQHRRRHSIILVAIWLWVAKFLILPSRAEDDGLDDLPPKGDPECLSLAERWDSFINGDGNDFWLTSCEGEDEDDDDGASELPAHGFTLEIYSSLPAFGPDYGTYVSWGTVAFLSEAAFAYDVKLNSTVDEIFSDRDRRPFAQFEAEVVLQDVVTTQIGPDSVHFRGSYWWRYELVFHCFWGSRNRSNLVGQPIQDTAVLQRVRRDLKGHLQTGVQLITDAFDVHELSHGVLGFSLQDPSTSDDPFGNPRTAFTASPSPSPDGTGVTASPRPDDGGIRGSQDDIQLEDPTYMSNINTQYWDWRRYLGLGIFVGTVVSTLLLTQTASYRRRQRRKKEVWGNLGTAEGVDALLNTGWKVKGSRMEVYDKKGLGYRDDDSMLMGGYYEQGAYMGAEITVTHDSVTTPDTVPQTPPPR